MVELYTTPTPSAQSLEGVLRGSLLQEDHPDYHTKRQVWNVHHNRHPQMIVVAHGAADVVHAVKYARAHKLPVSVRSGGHHVAGMGACDNGVMIDMTAMHSVVVDPKTQTAVVGGGAIARHVIHECQLFGLALPTGNIGGVGVSALALGGGMGYLRRQWGLTLDNLLAVDLVLPDGSFAHASPQEHPELFWALRGSGSNFGVATALYFQLHPVGPTVVGIHTVYDAKDIDQVIPQCIDFLEHSSREISLNIDVVSIPPIPQAPAPLAGKQCIMLTGMHAGSDLEKAVREVQPLRELAVPLMDGTGPISYETLHTLLDAILPSTVTSYTQSLYVHQWTADFFDAFSEEVRHAGPTQMMMLWPLGGKMAEPGADATAFGDRTAVGVVMIEGLWMDPGDREMVVSQVNDAYSRLLPFSHHGHATYLNLIGEGPHLAAAMKDTYQDNYPRLQRLKQQLDPDNLFCYNVNIKP